MFHHLNFRIPINLAPFTSNQSICFKFLKLQGVQYDWLQPHFCETAISEKVATLTLHYRTGHFRKLHLGYEIDGFNHSAVSSRRMLWFRLQGFGQIDIIRSLQIKCEEVSEHISVCLIWRPRYFLSSSSIVLHSENTVMWPKPIIVCSNDPISTWGGGGGIHPPSGFSSI